MPVSMPNSSCRQPTRLAIATSVTWPAISYNGRKCLHREQVMSIRLTVQDRSLFERDGYLIARSLLDREEAKGLLVIARSDAAIRQEAYAKKDASGGESRLVVRNTLDDSPYAAVVRSQRVAGNMQRLLGDEVYHWHHKMMLKEPHIGGAWEWHQDYGYWYNDGCLFPDMASCLIAVDRATRQNGCLQVIRGSHRLGRVDHLPVGGQTGADPERVAAALQRMERVYCELDPGDAIFFHSNTLHCSDPNRSPQPRWSLICCYNTRHNDPWRESKHPGYHPLAIQEDHELSRILVAAG
jgi:ectoine hydroxylase-related dioxygenase (phytanoyl-CoA dioxygenase family)